MRFLLINPYYPISETPSPPLGLAFLAGALERAGVEVRVLDFVVFPYRKETLRSVLMNFQPHFAGITSVTMTFDHAVSVLRDVKGMAPDVLTVMGGPHVTFCAKETMDALAELDFVILGEGDEAVVELAKEADKGRDWSRIGGLVYRHGPVVESTGMRAPGIEADSLPTPARHLLPLGRYRALHMPISMTTSRGCPFTCIFCVGRKMVGPKVRYRAPERVVDELEYLSSLNFHQINIADDLFTANKKHCLAVCEEIIRRRLQVTWTSFARVDTVSLEVLSRMKEAGCCAVSFGVESANADILKTIKKGITMEQVVAAVGMCMEVGITPQASFILGLPGETPETLKETTAFGEMLKKMGALHGFHLLAPFPGTEIREKSDGLGIKILTSDWREYHANRAIVETPFVDRNMLDDIVIAWEEKFDQWLGDIKRRLGTGEATEEETAVLTNLEHTVLIYDLMMDEVIEEKGFWGHTGKPVSQGRAFKGLVDRVADSTDYTRKQVDETLGLAVEKGNLTWREDKGIIRWEWVDYL
ncbi:MAG: B12-binding domain-containing radical SAM protein [Deltaproteobacteria bacterium]|nr:B12-binding domain-containing radical SAM protein [Deltaproteobacteria bacterium]